MPLGQRAVRGIPSRRPAKRSCYSADGGRSTGTSRQAGKRVAIVAGAGPARHRAATHLQIQAVIGMDNFAQVLLLLGTTVTVVVAFQRLHIPSSLGYLLVGIILGPHTVGPVVDLPQIKSIAEFGIVFLLFTIGLNFSLPQLHALRHQVLGLGTGQVAFTTLLVGMLAWLGGLPPTDAFILGAVFAQSSTTIIGKQLGEQGEENSRHGRLGLALSVFQDVTAVPFLVVLPVLGQAMNAKVLAVALGGAMAKAFGAFVAVFVAGRWVLRPVFRLVARRRSTEVFTLTVLLVALLAAWSTQQFGLSLAFGAFLAGMMMGETEFRHQLESTIRPFRDVLLGLFFVDIGMLFDPAAMPRIWHWALFGAGAMLAIKALLVAVMVNLTGIDRLTAWRTGLIVAVGGEFGFALLAIAIGHRVIEVELAQIILTAVLFSMIAGPILIRFNHGIATLFGGRKPILRAERELPRPDHAPPAGRHDHVILCGYGRIGQSVGHFLTEEDIPFVAIDLDADCVREAHTAGEPVYFGDSTQDDLLESLGLQQARLVLISFDDVPAALRILSAVKSLRPGLPVMVRTRDETHVEELQQAGALEVVPDTLEASLMIASQALLLLDVPIARILRRLQQERSNRYRLMRELFRGNDLYLKPQELEARRLHAIPVPPESACARRRLSDIDWDGVTVTALVRNGKRLPHPSPRLRLRARDVVVVCGQDDQVHRVEQLINA